MVAKTRKRCPNCQRMIEVGEEAVLTDDRRMESHIHWFGREYQRGAFHLWHPECHADHLRLVAEAKVRADAERDALFAEMRAAVVQS